ncbi:efflux RND transporter periplasmic adaptor subunit [Tardiphaga sp.]|jgi:membrane fusion protein (multidrug efflux system)|uniref:HlyD family secretion protein n=1 Tax=Tardiphaga sp. TaxID=1926292 RepID=UPI0037DA456A
MASSQTATLSEFEDRDRSDPPRDDAAPKRKAREKTDQPDHGTEDKEPEAKPSLRERLRRHWMLTTLGVIVLLVGIVAGVMYWLAARHYETTDDAFVDARSFSVAAKVGGYVTDVLVTDNQHVETGAVLAQIDTRDYVAARDQAQAQVEQAQANITNVEAQIFSQEAQVQQARDQADQAAAQLQFAEQEASRAQELVQKGAGTVQQQQRTKSDLEAQQANDSRAKTGVTSATRQIDVLKAQQKSAEAGLAQARAQLEQAELNLSYTKITAAQAGRVVKLSGAKGTLVNAGQSLMMFVPDDIWVTANYKETQVTDMRPGQPAEIRIDAYPDHKITGKVASVQPGSGTVFSLLPAENATGNYVKVVQRVPVKIVVDQWPTDVTIGPGMSVVPKVKVR